MLQWFRRCEVYEGIKILRSAGAAFNVMRLGIPRLDQSTSLCGFVPVEGCRVHALAGALASLLLGIQCLLECLIRELRCVCEPLAIQFVCRREDSWTCLH